MNGKNMISASMVTNEMKKNFSSFFKESSVEFQTDENNLSKIKQDTGLTNGSGQGPHSNSLSKDSLFGRLLARIKNNSEKKSVMDSKAHSEAVSILGSIGDKISKIKNTILPTDSKIGNKLVASEMSKSGKILLKSKNIAIYTAKNALAGVALLAMASLSLIGTILGASLKIVFSIVKSAGQLIFDFITTPAGFAITMIMFAWIKKFGIGPVWKFLKDKAADLLGIISDFVKNNVINKLFGSTDAFSEWLYLTITRHLPFVKEAHQRWFAKKYDNLYGKIVDNYSKLMRGAKTEPEKKEILVRRNRELLKWANDFVDGMNRLGINMTTEDTVEELRSVYKRQGRSISIDKEGSPYIEGSIEQQKILITPTMIDENSIGGDTTTFQKLDPTWKLILKLFAGPTLHNHYYSSPIAKKGYTTFGKTVIITNNSNSKAAHDDVVGQLVNQGATPEDAEYFWNQYMLKHLGNNTTSRLQREAEGAKDDELARKQFADTLASSTALVTAYDEYAGKQEQDNRSLGNTIGKLKAKTQSIGDRINRAKAKSEALKRLLENRRESISKKESAIQPTENDVIPLPFSPVQELRSPYNFMQDSNTGVNAPSFGGGISF